MTGMKAKNRAVTPIAVLEKIDRGTYATERVLITDNLNYINPNPIPSETLPPQETSIFTKRIGSTNYRVYIHFSKTSRETMNDKVLRLVKNEAVKP